MKGAIVYEVDKPIEVTEIETSALGESDARVRMGAAGLCHSDVSVQTGTLPWPLPMVLGHEGAGVVEEVGSRVTHVSPGDQVVMAGVLHCGECRYCAQGTPTLCAWGVPYMFESLAPGGVERATDSRGRPLRQMCCLGTIAESAVVPASAAVKIQPDIPLEVAAMIGCAATTGLGAVFNRARVHPGSTAVVVGCGGIGLNVVQGARISGAHRIIAIDPTPTKRNLALQFGATDVIDPAAADPVEQTKELTKGYGADYVIESVGTPEVVQQSWNMAGIDGTIVVVGVPDPSTLATFNIQQLALSQKKLTGCFFGGGRPHHDTPRYLDMYQQGQLKLDELITKTYHIDQVNDAIDDLNAGRNARGVFLFDGLSK